MLKKIAVFILSNISLFALSFSSAGTIAKDKYININGKNYQYVIGTASKSGTYYAAGMKLTKLLPDSIEAETDGSLQNMDLLDEGKINVAFVQGDAYNLWCNSHKSRCENDFEVIETGHQEVVQIMSNPKKSDITTDSDLQSNKVTIDVGPLNSGGSASWDNMSLLEPNFKKAKKIIDDAMDESVIFKVKENRVNALIRTATWNPNDSFTKEAIENNLRFVDVKDWDLNDKIKINGEDKPIYKFVKVKIKYPGDFLSTTIKTIQIQTYLVVNKQYIGRKQMNKLFDIVYRLGNGLW